MAYPYRDNYPFNEIDIPHNSYQECCCQHVMLRCMAPYARLMQATQGPKHASNLMHVISRDKFQSCHWPLLEYVVFLALHALRCVLLEIALNAGSACVGRRGSVLLPVWAFQMTLAEIIIALCIVVEHMACWPIFMVRLYIVSDSMITYILTYGKALADRIVLYRDILCDIVSYLYVVFFYGCIVPSLLLTRLKVQLRDYHYREWVPGSFCGIIMK